MCFKKIAAALAGVFFFVMLTGCADKKEEVLSSVKTKIMENYSISAEVVDMTEIKMSNVGGLFYYGYAYNTASDPDNPYCTFSYKISEDGTIFEDSYYASRFAKSFNSHYKRYLKNQEAVVVTNVMSSNTLSSTSKTNYKTAFTLGLSYDVTCILPTDTTIDARTEAENLRDIMGVLEDEAFKGNLYIVYCYPEYKETLLQFYNHYLKTDFVVDSSKIIADASIDFSSENVSMQNLYEQLFYDVN